MIARCWIILFCVWFAGICHAQHASLEKANNFVYTQADGTQHALYALQSEMILLYFYDPTCEECHALMEQLNESEFVNQLIADNRLSILAVYPEDDMEIWEPYVSRVPSTWINGYDKGATVHSEGLYFFISTPVLYLLDEEKNICIQTTSFEAIEQELMKKGRGASDK